MSIVADLRHGVRLLARAPGFSLIAIAALAIGIGANTAIFTVVHALLLKELPYGDPERLVMVWEHNVPGDRRANVVSPGNYLHWREMQQSFEELAAVGLTRRLTLTGAGEPEELPVQLVTASFFPVVGVQPALGRPFSADEDAPGSRLVVISDRLWKRRFNADPAILDQTITLQGAAFTVVGVMPAGFSFFDTGVEMWLPVGFNAESRTPRGRWLMVVGKLRQGVDIEDAERDMQRVHGELARLFPEFNTGWTAQVVRLREQLTGDVRPAVLLLSAAVAIVLLIACANVANLLLARATSRQRELAVRAALGAGRGRLVRQLLAENLVLSAAGGLAGLLLAWWGVNLLRAATADRLPIPRLDTMSIDAPVFAFTLAVSLLSALVFGLVPALTASGAAMGALKDGGRSGSSARGRRARSAFVVAEIALALVLLAGAGLLVRSFVNLLRVDTGFEPSRTITFSLSLPASRYADLPQRAQFFGRLFDRLNALPGAASSGAVSFLPLTGLGAATHYEVPGEETHPPGAGLVTNVRVVTGDYFDAMGIPLVRGRFFDTRDQDPTTNVVIVNESLARRHWPGQDPIGRRIRISWGDNREDEVIGVVADVRLENLEQDARPTTYWPYPRVAYGWMTVAIRGTGDPTHLGGSVPAVVRELDPLLAVANLRSMEEVVSASLAERRLTMQVITLFAAAALLLAALGVYGVIAYSATERTREIGIRLALGARGADVLGMLVREGMGLAAVGVAIGLAGAFALTTLMRDLLFQTPPADPVTLAGVTLMILLIVLAASYVPGRRAARVDPAVALRAE